MKRTRTLCAAALLAFSALGASAQILIGQTAGMTGSVAASVNEMRQRPGFERFHLVSAVNFL